MVYVEWLRVRGALKWTAIVLGGLLIVTAVVRVWAFGLGGDALAHIARLQADPSSRVTETTAPDGAHRTVIDDPRERTHVVVDEYGWGRKHIEILDRSSRDHSNESIVAGSIRVRTLPSGAGSLVVIDTNGIPLATFAIVGLVVALVFATLVGSPFARENDGHLEIALTKPVGRTALGIATIAVDAAGIVTVFAIGVAFAFLCTALFELPRVTFDTSDVFATLLGIVAPLSWYALLNVATASMKRGYGTVIGFAWPVALLIVGISRIPPHENMVLLAVTKVFRGLAVLDPVSYMHVSMPVEVAGRLVVGRSTEFNVLALALLAVLYGALAVFQWRRVEN
ncbi:MAG: hypothetical protein WB615_12310 [Candidatus Tumulicola sp.]